MLFIVGNANFRPKGKKVWHPVGESNPRCVTENHESWATRRTGPKLSSFHKAIQTQKVATPRGIEPLLQE